MPQKTFNDVLEEFIPTCKPVARIKIKSYADFVEFFTFLQTMDKKTASDILHHSPKILGKKIKRTSEHMDDEGTYQVAMLPNGYLVHWYMKTGETEILEMPKLD